jgi:hypothetical protein
MSRLLDSLSEANHAIVLAALDDHAKHYRCLCHWIKCELAKPKTQSQVHQRPASNKPSAIGRTYRIQRDMGNLRRANQMTLTAQEIDR